MNKKFLQSVVAGLVGLTLIASCSHLGLKKDSSTCGAKNGCSSKESKETKESAKEVKTEKKSKKSKRSKKAEAVKVEAKVETKAETKTEEKKK